MKNIVHDDNHLSKYPKKAIDGKNFSNKINKQNNKNVLIIEDQEIARKVHEFYLKPFELTLTFAVDAQSALDAITKSLLPFELIILDVVLPDINGLLLAKELRKKGVKAPIVVVSANSVSARQKKLLRSCIQAFYVKPLVAKQYRKIICEFLSK